eukprot:comp22791_c1_seq1/m.35697 comp22791_c1_seq1/g.35697  ORF comp22791_c1_seq1/g.35697 comp22791_c1_seq1/m.35697 type:complete len:349 (-) comp22791_c1_seq1:270-1316(-)
MTFSEFAAKYSRDPRFKELDKMKEREQVFTEHIAKLKSEEAQKKQEKEEKKRNDFIGLLKEVGKVHVDSVWKRVKDRIRDDPRYRLYDTDDREKIFNEYVAQLRREDPDIARKEREEASLRERERQVRASRQELKKDLEKEKANYLKEEGLNMYKDLLRDSIRKADMGWTEGKNKIRDDRRYKDCGLDIDEKERLFREHVRGLMEKTARPFRQLIDETPGLKLTSTWEEVRPKIEDDARYERFGGSDRERESEFRMHMREKMKQARADFRSLLRETRFITHKSRREVAKDRRALTAIIQILENDKRYIDLDCVTSDRDEILADYLKDLEDRGTPPPVTATVRQPPPRT